MSERNLQLSCLGQVTTTDKDGFLVIGLKQSLFADEKLNQ